MELSINSLTEQQTLELLKQWDVPPHLLRHVQLVAQVAKQLCEWCENDNIEINAQWITIAALFHDVGKILHPEELRQSGSLHEEAGQKWLQQHGINDSLCRICVSHAQWSKMDCTLEELIVALADKLWKGKRVTELEERVIQEIANQHQGEYWTLYTRWDQRFEDVASKGSQRLSMSTSFIQ